MTLLTLVGLALIYRLVTGLTGLTASVSLPFDKIAQVTSGMLLKPLEPKPLCQDLYEKI